MKRFWKTVSLEEVVKDDQCTVSEFVWERAALTSSIAHFLIKLDNRALKTPGGNVLALPGTKRLAATLIANEWESQERLIKPHALPMVRLHVISFELCL